MGSHVMAKQPKKEATDLAGKKIKMVRLRDEFHKRVAHIAHARDMDIGDLIETQLQEWVNREYRRLVLEEADRVKREG